MLSKRIVVIGGSNAVIEHSYPQVLESMGYDITCYGIGDTTSLTGLTQILKHDILGNFDIMLFDYLTGDINHFFRGCLTVEHVEKTLTVIYNLCAEHNIQLLPIFIYNSRYFPQSDLMNHSYDNCKMFAFYKKFIKDNALSYINVPEFLKKEFNDEWESVAYRDTVHLNKHGMRVLAETIANNLNDLGTLTKIDDTTPGNVKLIPIETIKPTERFKNTLVDVDYHELSDSIEILFDRPTELLAIEYLCDLECGYISLETDQETIHRQTLIQGGFVNTRKKSQLTTMVLCNKKSDPTNRVKICVIDKPDKQLYSRHKSDFPTKLNEKTNLKLVSLLILEH